MIAIGDFSFPSQSTVMQVSAVEAKSKVRKEIRIQSMVSESLDEMRNAIEAFDRGGAVLSLHEGRFYKGRRRELHITPLPSAMSWVDFRILTNDRFERSSALHSYTNNTSSGQADFMVNHLGNWQSPLCATLQPSNPVNRVEIITANENFILEDDLQADSTIMVDSENRLVTVDGTNHYASANEEFPFLGIGENLVSILIQPSDALVGCTVQYRDFWV